MTRRYLLERRGLPVLACLLAVAGWEAAELWRDAPLWWGWVPGVLGCWARGALVPFMLASMVAAYLGAADRYDGVEDLVRVSARSPASRIGRQVGALAGVLLGCLLIPLLVALALSLRAGAGLPPTVVPACLLLVVSVCSALAAVMTVGWVLGARLPRWLAVPVSVALPYTWVLTVSSLGAPGEVGLPWTWWDNLDWASTHVGALTLLWRTVLWVGLALLLLSAHAGLARGTVRACAAVVLTATAVLGWVGLRVVPVPGADDAVCDDGAVTVCTPRHAAAGLSRYAAQVRQLTDTLPARLRPRAVVGSVSDLPARQETGAVYAPSARGEHADVALGDPLALEAALGQAVFMGACTDRTPGNDAAAVATVWWWESRGNRVESLPDYRRFTRAQLTTAEQAALDRLLADPRTPEWMNQHSQRLAACELRLEELP